MTVSSSTDRASFSGNGAATAFSLPFRFFANSDVIAKAIDDATGVAIPLTLGIDYLLTGAGEPEEAGAATGVLTTSAPVPVGVTLFVQRIIPATQPTDIVNQGRFFPEVHETVFDRLTMLVQQSQGALDRTLRVQDFDPVPNRLPSAVQRANRILSFDENGNPVAIDAASESSLALRQDLANPTNPIKGAGLVGYKGRTVAQRLGDSLTPLDFGAVGDGVADDTNAVQDALSAAAGGLVNFVPGNTYRVTSTIELPAGTIINGYGAVILCQTQIIALEIAAQCRIFGLTITGPGGGYAVNGTAIKGYGVRNGPGVAPTFLDRLVIEDCKISGFGNYAIDLAFVKDSEITNNKIQNIGYGGVFIYSGSNCKVLQNTVDTLHGETVSGELNAYGITFTSLVNAADFIRDPRSVDCIAAMNLVKNIPTWHGLDTHGGNRCIFADNTVINCRRAAILTNLTTAGASNCVVSGNLIINTLTGTNSNGTQKKGEAIWDVGPSSSVRNFHNHIRHNYIIGHGDPVSALGSIFVENAEDGDVSSNTVNESNIKGIRVNSNVRRYSISYNRIADVTSPGAGSGATDFPACLSFDGSNWTDIDVSHNTFSRKTPALAAKVSELGVLVGNTPTKTIRFLQNGFDGVTSPFSLSDLSGLIGEIYGQFTATLTGCTTSPTMSIHYSVSDRAVTLSLTQDVSGTSNSNTMTLTGLPVFLTPLANRYCGFRGVNSGIAEFCTGIVAPSGVISFFRGADLGSWTASGLKGISQYSAGYTI
jgi:parallel beta-helix repeat protein